RLASRAARRLMPNSWATISRFSRLVIAGSTAAYWPARPAELGVGEFDVGESEVIRRVRPERHVFEVVQRDGGVGGVGRGGGNGGGLAEGTRPAPLGTRRQAPAGP